MIRAPEPHTLFRLDKAHIMPTMNGIPLMHNHPIQLIPYFLLLPFPILIDPNKSDILEVNYLLKLQVFRILDQFMVEPFH